MRPTMQSSLFVLVATLISSTFALQALESSPCASKCGNVLDQTSGEGDITCLDREYTTTSKGTVYQNCINCQLTSKYVDPRTKETDLQWALYNLRYAVSWCLFGYPNNTEHGSNPCITSTACGKLENAFEFDSLSPNATAYGYCALMHEDILPKCNACVAQSDEFYVTNFITALAAACRQQPILGSTISIEGNIFSRIKTNITDPNATAKSVHKPPPGGLPLGAKVGIAIGSLALVLTILGCCIVWRGKKRRRAFLEQRQKQPAYAEWVAQQVSERSPHPGMGFPPHSAGGFFQDSPQSAVSQQPLFPHQDWGMGRGRHEEDTSPAQEKKFFSPYSSNYSSPISATEQAQVVAREWPMDRKSSFGGSAPRAPLRSASGSGERQGEREGDRIEMQNVTPVLLHPGHGRRSGDA